MCGWVNLKHVMVQIHAKQATNLKKNRQRERKAGTRVRKHTYTANTHTSDTHANKNEECMKKTQRKESAQVCLFINK